MTLTTTSPKFTTTPAPAMAARRHCHECGAAYQGKPLPEDRLMERCQRLEGAHLCPPCRKASFALAQAEFSVKRRDEAATIGARRAKAWEKFLAANGAELMLGTNEALLRKRPEFAKVQDWRYSPRGLVLGGESGLCKTRMAFWLLHREHMAGRRVGYLNCATFHARLMAASRKGFGTDGELLEAWERVDLLLIDDLGKGGIGDQHEGKLFGLIDARAIARRPIIATQNVSGADLEAAMAPDRGAPFMRRLREFNDPIKFL